MRLTLIRIKEKAHQWFVEAAKLATTPGHLVSRVSPAFNALARDRTDCLRQPAINNMNSSMHLCGEIQIMSDRDNGLPVHRHKVTKDSEHLRGRQRIQAPGRLVGEDYRRVVGQCPCHGDALPLPAGQLVGRFVKVIAQSERYQQFLGA